MSGKNAKMLRRLSSTTGAGAKTLKRAWLRISHKERGESRPLLAKATSKPSKE